MKVIEKIKDSSDFGFWLDSSFTPALSNGFYVGKLEKCLSKKTLANRIDTSIGYSLSKQDYVCELNGRNLFFDKLPSLFIFPVDFSSERFICSNVRELDFGKTLPLVTYSKPDVKKINLSDEYLDKISNDFKGLAFVAKTYGDLDTARFAQEFAFRRLVSSYRNNLALGLE